MNLNLGKFKKISENHESAVLRHPDGHEIRISKKILSPETHGELKKLPMHLAGGGEVSSEESENDKNKYLTEIDNAGPQVSVQPEQADPEVIAAESAPQKTAQDLYQDRLNENKLADQFTIPYGYAQPDPSKIPEKQTLDQLVGEKEKGDQAKLDLAKRAQEAHDHDVKYIMDQNLQRQKLGLPSLPLPVNPNAPSAMVADAGMNQGPEMPGSGQITQPSPTPPQTPQTNSAPSAGGIIQSDLTKPYDTAMAGVQNQLQATQGLGRIESEQAKANEGIYKQNVQNQQVEQERARSIFDTLQKEHDMFMQDYRNQHIDPDHYLNSMGTGSKISTFIGLILGGLQGQGRNEVSSFLDKQIANDMEAQKAEMGKKHNLISANFQQFGNMKQAEDMYIAQTKSILADQILQQANKSGSPAALERAKLEAGKLQYDASQKLQGIAFQQMANEQMNKGMNQTASPGGAQVDNTPNLIQSYRLMGRHDLADDLQKRYVPGVGLAKVQIPESVREKIQTRQNLDNKVNELIKFTKENQGTISLGGPESAAIVRRGEAMVNLLTDAYRQANQQGVFKESEKNFVGSFLKQDPTAFFASFRTLPGYQQVHQDNLDTLNSLKQSVGLPTTFVPKSAQPYKGRNG